MNSPARVVAVTLLAFLLGSCTNPGSWAEVEDQYRFALSGRAWKMRAPITIDSTGIPEDVVNFPVLITLTPSDLDTRSCGPGGRAVQFRASDGTTVLAHQVDTWDPEGESLIWVRVPILPADAPDTRIWLYYDNPYASEPDRGAEVWSNDYLGVWHLNESSPGIYADSTSNRWYGQTGPGGFSAPTPAPGRIGGSQEYLNSTDAIFLPALSGTDLRPMTLSFWVRAAAMPGGRRFFNKRAVDVRSASGAVPPHKLAVEIGFDDGDPGTEPDSLLLEQVNELDAALIGNWHWYCIAWTGTGACGTADDTQAGAHVYRDGLLRSGNRGVIRNGVGSYKGDDDAPAFIGNASWNNAAVLGRFDEVRLSGVRRSPAWIRAEYLSMTGAMATLGEPEALSYE